MKQFSRVVCSCLLTLCAFAVAEGNQISSNGFWVGEDVHGHHAFDPKLAFAMAEFLKNENAKTTVDFGCGLGNYVDILKLSQIDAKGYDGNPDTPKLTGGQCEVQDLSIPFNLNKKFDWVISLEVGEHLPAQYETIFMENLIKHAKNGIILSWAVKGQGGYGHFNEQPNDYIKKKMMSYGLYNDVEAENKLREKSTLWWFKNTIMVFRTKDDPNAKLNMKTKETISLKDSPKS